MLKIKVRPTNSSIQYFRITAFELWRKDGMFIGLDSFVSTGKDRFKKKQQRRSSLVLLLLFLPDQLRIRSLSGISGTVLPIVYT